MKNYTVASGEPVIIEVENKTNWLDKKMFITRMMTVGNIKREPKVVHTENGEESICCYDTIPESLALLMPYCV